MNNEFVCPPGYTGGPFLLNAPGGQVIIYVCQQPAVVRSGVAFVTFLDMMRA